jgi:choline monooxygenase
MKPRPAEDNRQLIPPAAYTSDAYFQQEQDLLFSRCWNFAGMVDDVPNPGDYRCTRAGRYPLVIVRDDEGELRAFHNICRHRGMQFLEGSGSSLRGLVCPFHKWFYKLDGRLKAIPRQAELFPGIDKSRLGLLPASVGEFRGMLFVHPEPSPAEDFEAFVEDLEPSIGPHHPDQMVEIGIRRFEYRANWKIVVETYMDTYHLFYLHEKSAPMFDHSQFDWSRCGRHCLLYEPVHKKHKDWVYKTYGINAADCVPGLDPEAFGGQFHMLFPNIGWTAMAHLWNSFHAIPVAVDKTIVETRIRVMPSAAEQIKSSHEHRGRFGECDDGTLITLEDTDMHPTESGNSVFEDMWACQQMQKGMMSPAFRVGALARKFEDMITVYQRQILEFVGYS